MDTLYNIIGAIMLITYISIMVNEFKEVNKKG